MLVTTVNVENTLVDVHLVHQRRFLLMGGGGVWSAVVMNRYVDTWKKLLLLWFWHDEGMDVWITLDLLGLLGCSHPLNFTVLWSSYACRPSGYLNVAWSQSLVNQISNDLAGLADKTLHRRKWQTVGDKRPVCRGAMKPDWSTSPQTPPFCLHVLCFIWFSSWF